MNKFTCSATVVSNWLFGLDPTVVVVDYCGLLPIIAIKNLSNLPIRVSRLTCFWIKSDLIGSNMNNFTCFGLDPTVVVVDYCGLLSIIAACTAVVGF